MIGRFLQVICLFLQVIGMFVQDDFLFYILVHRSYGKLSILSI